MPEANDSTAEGLPKRYRKSNAGIGERLQSLIMESLMLKLAVAGILMILLGATVVSGVFAGMFAVWGVSIFLYGIGFYLLLRYAW